MKKEEIGYVSLISLAVVSILVLFTLSPIIQDKKYHNFCDSDTIFNIPNFWNVVSNLPFLIVGSIGLLKVSKFSESKIQYIVFFIGVFLVSIGSGYYHLNPNNDTLVWDRLPMTIAFMSLFSIVISEFIDQKKGFKLLIPALFTGVLSVIYWLVFKDLRIYVLVQFYPIIAMPLILIFFKSAYSLSIGYWMLSAGYLLAKIFEYYDFETQNALKVVSGHTLKHILAALGIACLLLTFIKRRKKIKILEV